MSIVIENVTKSYGDKKVFEGFSYCLEEGKTTAIMGESGCGKTTLLRMILGFENVDCGSISGVMENVAVVFQEDRLCKECSVLENIRLVLRQKENREQIQKCLIQLGIGSESNTIVSQLSGGMKRRVAIARALLFFEEQRKRKGSCLVVLDEPFKGLDEKTKEFTMAYVKEVLKGQTVLLVTHDKEEAAFMASEMLKL